MKIIRPASQEEVQKSYLSGLGTQPTTCSCGVTGCEPTGKAYPGREKVPCMTCGQPAGNHCYSKHVELQQHPNRFDEDGGLNELFVEACKEARAVRMAQMGWEDDWVPPAEASR
jgi:hypothetical protein